MWEDTSALLYNQDSGTCNASESFRSWPGCAYRWFAAIKISVAGFDSRRVLIPSVVMKLGSLSIEKNLSMDMKDLLDRAQEDTVCSAVSPHYTTSNS